MTHSPFQDMLRKVNATLPRRFEEIAAAFPGQPAVHADASTCSYDTLNRLANRLAHAFIARGATPGCRIALLMSRGLPQIATMIATLKAGGIVVALNATDSIDRLREIVADAEPALLVTDAEHRDRAAEIAGTGCGIVSFEEGSEGGREDNPGVVVAPDDAALLIYTSGSTGRPRGVMRSHRHALHNAFTHVGVWELTREDRVALLMPLSGGNGTTIAWAALVTGAALEPFDVLQESVIVFADKLVAGRTTVLCATASFFRSFIKTLPDTVRFPDLRVLRLGTEAVVSSDFQAFKRLCPPTSRFVQTFGSSETGNIAQLVLGHDDVVPHGRLPAGSILDDIEVRLLDDDGRDVVRGDTGRIVVRSPYLAAGYWRDAALTAARFSEEGGVRVFRSGDLGRINSAGQLELIGRSDDIVKIRGYRVALSEVEGAVLSLPDVSSAAVVATKDETPRLVAYVVAQQGLSLRPVDMRSRLRTKLSTFMMPSHFVMMDALPLGQTGKIDRMALAAMNPGVDHAVADAPATNTEIALATMWAEALKLPSVGRGENFFDLGGDSLAAAVIGAQVHAAYALEIGLQAFVEFPTLAHLAAHIDRAPRTGARPNELASERADRTRPLPLSLLQERVWKYSQTAELSEANTQFKVYRLSGALDLELFRASVAEVARRHELLRTSFAVVDQKPVQLVHPDIEMKVSYVDVSGRDDAEAEALRLCQLEQSKPLDFHRAPLFRLMLFRVAEREHLLARQVHQLVKDKWSNAVFLKELSLLYDAGVRGAEPPRLEPIPVQYADYAAWQHKAMAPGMPLLRESLSWWAKNLADARPLDLDHLRHDEDKEVSLDKTRLSYAVPLHTIRRLAAVGRAQHATYFAVQQAAVAACLAAETGDPNVLLGNYVSIRKQRPSLQNTFGPFLNLTALHYRLDADLSFGEWIGAVRDRLTETEAHCDLPYETLSAELAAQGIRTPEIRLIFNSTENEIRRIGDLTMVTVPFMPRIMPWGFTLAMDERICWAIFDGRLYDPAAVTAFLERFGRLLDAFAEQPDTPMRELLYARPVARRKRPAASSVPSLPRRIAGRIMRRFIG